MTSIVGTDIPPILGDNLRGFSLMAGGANVIMQLSRLPVGHGVAKSTVRSGRVDVRPLKRLRTTSAFLLIALYGTDDERLELRKQIDRQHAQVRSGPDDEVAYNAFDRDLQLWVAACLYRGVLDLLELLHGDVDDATLDEVYVHCQRLGTTLQVRPDDWPPTRAEFDVYWADGVESIEMDDLTRRYLRGIAELQFVVAPLGPWAAPLRPLLAPFGRLTTLGFLPPRFRDELGYRWTRVDQRRFDALMRAILAVDKLLPPPVRAFPLNVFLADTRRRLATGTPVI